MHVSLPGKAFIGIGFYICYIITAELYPTNLRTQAVAICSLQARVFGFGSSYISKLALYWPPLPMVMLAIPSLAAALLTMLFVGETAKKSLPQNMHDIEATKEEMANNGFEMQEEKKNRDT